MKNALFAFVALLLGAAAHAADLPITKAPASSPWFSSAYPYQTSGIFFGAYTAGSGGSVAATVPGVGAASLTTTTAEIGGTVGWAWGQKNSPISYTVEGDFGITNFNGNQAGFSLQGPLSFEQGVTIWTPFTNLQNLLPNWPSNLFGTVPPFAPLAPGVTASNLQSGFGVFVKEKDISTSFQGVASNKIWRIYPALRLTAMEQLSNGSALYAYAEAAFPTDGKILGPVPGSTATLGTEYTAGVGVRW
jgi:hypothetical protein